MQGERPHHRAYQLVHVTKFGMLLNLCVTVQVQCQQIKAAISLNQLLDFMGISTLPATQLDRAPDVCGILYPGRMRGMSLVLRIAPTVSQSMSVIYNVVPRTRHE